MINIGSKQLKGISVGNRAVKAVYKGSQKVWSSTSWKTIWTGNQSSGSIYITFKRDVKYRMTFNLQGSSSLITSPYEFVCNKKDYSFDVTNSVYSYADGQRHTATGSLCLRQTANEIKLIQGSTSYLYENINTGEIQTRYVYAYFIVTKVEEFS